MRLDTIRKSVSVFAGVVWCRVCRTNYEIVNNREISQLVQVSYLLVWAIWEPGKSPPPCSWLDWWGLKRKEKRRKVGKKKRKVRKKKFKIKIKKEKMNKGKKEGKEGMRK